MSSTAWATRPRDDRPASADDAEAKVARYYEGTHLTSPFEDLDRSFVYTQATTAIRDPGTLNFIVDFGGARELPEAGRARCALNVGPAGVAELLARPRPRELRTRWINIFGPERQKLLVDAITSYYGFSPRLMNVITTPAPTPTKPRPAVLVRRRTKRQRVFGAFRRGSHDEDVEDQADSDGAPGLENGVPLVHVEQHYGATQMNYMNLVQNVWHWHAVEFGGRYICIGSNTLHNVARPDKPSATPTSDTPDGEEDEFDDGDYDPEGRRLWSWLVLCDDGTVISLHESVADTSPADLLTIRRNLLTVFRALSHSEAALAASARDSGFSLGGGLDSLPFRRHLPNQDGENVEGGPSLLLYYLLDDWTSSYAFVLGRGYPYSTYMRALRRAMGSHPELSHLGTLNKLARQLDTLKRMYETKRIIIESLLNRHENRGRHPKHGPLPASTPRSREDFVPVAGNPDVLGVPLDALAVAKLERLRDRIKLYALGELESLLNEKNELENAAFNLISLKENETVEKLTRITIWLTKVTFVFMPLTLVTGYFSMQLKDINNVYDLRAFWGSAGVAVALSLVVLYTVGKSTGTSDMRAMWDGFVEVWGFWRGVGRREGQKVRSRLEKQRSAGTG